LRASERFNGLWRDDIFTMVVNPSWICRANRAALHSFSAPHRGEFLLFSALSCHGFSTTSKKSCCQHAPSLAAAHLVLVRRDHRFIMSPRADGLEVQQLVNQYVPATRVLIAAARRAMKAAFPKVLETADAKAKLIAYSYGPGYKGVVATLILSRTELKIGIPFGAMLADPTGILKGAGKVHCRHSRVALGPRAPRPERVTEGQP
jgi:hypothetical protein